MFAKVLIKVQCHERDYLVSLGKKNLKNVVLSAFTGLCTGIHTDCDTHVLVDLFSSKIDFKIIHLSFVGCFAYK